MPELVVEQQWAWPGVLAGVVLDRSIPIRVGECPVGPVDPVSIWMRWRYPEGWKHRLLKPDEYHVSRLPDCVLIRILHEDRTLPHVSCTIVLGDWFSPVLLVRPTVPTHPQKAMQHLLCGTDEKMSDYMVTVSSASLPMGFYLSHSEYQTLYVRAMTSVVRRWRKMQPLRLVSLGKRSAPSTVSTEIHSDFQNASFLVGQKRPRHGGVANSSVTSVRVCGMLGPRPRPVVDCSFSAANQSV